LARKRAIALRALAVQALHERFLASSRRKIHPKDERERRSLAAATECGVSVHETESKRPCENYSRRP
jgi:hypothetical protein